MYAFRPNTEHIPVFQSAGNLVPIGIPAEFGRNVPPSLQIRYSAEKGTGPADSVNYSLKNTNRRES